MGRSRRIRAKRRVFLASSVEEVERDRLASVRTLADRYGAVAVLKGANTLVAAAGGPPAVCDRGNPGMASGGMGDVLAGMIGGLLVQTHDLRQSARAGVLLHALAGDDAARLAGSAARSRPT